MASAVVALGVPDLLTAAVVTTAFSFTAAILYMSMGAIDVGFTEAVVGAGIVGVFFVAALSRTTRKTKD
ncbi:MAG TPA: hydrogenase subunit MbhD domain-containing protein [Opitutales bacterium]|nr:hydrogenase subunit MbhD domain-containing protein [Opitutales bacterium]